LQLVRGTAALDRRLVRPILTIGNFDGIHLGHRAILETVIARARALGGVSVLYTFDPHPRKVLRPDQAPDLLATMDQKIEILEDLGLDVLIVEHFDRAFARTEPKVFIREYIRERIDPIEVYVGYDFHFGRDREGSMRFLTETGPRLGFSVTIIPEVTAGEFDVNSTRIRKLISEGMVEEAGRLLGRRFSMRGPVIQGMQRGRGLGYPTANLAPANEIVPQPGVYTCRLRFLDDGEPSRGTILPAVTNVGYRPTFQEPGAEQNRLNAEAHLLDFSGDIYGRLVELQFLSRIRSEQKFESVEALRKQIARDVESARERLREEAAEMDGVGG
jgi:riboflavin kinase/FMN adenylyltransferase